MKQENVMVNDGQVTLVGFGSVRKLAHRPKNGFKQYRVLKHDGGSTITEVDSSNSSLYNEISVIYLLMISLLLKAGYSAFESCFTQDDADECAENSTSSYHSKNSKSELREYGKKL